MISMKQPLFSLGDGPKEPLTPPGEFPFTRGIYPQMYTSQLWTMRQYAGFGDALASNQRYKYLLSQGTTGLSMAFDLPTQMGYDSDHPLAQGEVGRVGVAISSLEDMRTVLSGLPLEQISTSMTINATAPILLSFYLAVADEQNIARNKLRGTIQNDVLKEYIARGTYIFPPEVSLKISTDVFEFCRHEVPSWNTISISGYHIREAGSTAIQELAFTLSNGLAYVKTATDRGLHVDDFAPRLSFFFNVHNDFFEEIAKFRAARRLWAKLMKERFSPKNPKSMMLRFHTQTAGCTLIANQVDTNTVRVTLQCLAAILGGTQSLHTNSRDEALGLPTEDSVTLALRTQQIVAHESGATRIIDPLAGSYAVEALTDSMEAETLKLILEIENRGGVIKCIQDGWQQNLIHESAYRYQREIESKERIIVGLNSFNEEGKTSVPVFEIEHQIEKKQIDKLKSFKKNRGLKTVEKQKDSLRSAAKENRNLLPPIFDAVKNNLTLGEICEALCEVYGRYKHS